VRLSGVLQVALEHGHIPGNPVRAVRKVSADSRPEVRPLAPAQLEALIDRYLMNRISEYFGSGQRSSATTVSSWSPSSRTRASAVSWLSRA
jgi:hypothetical protein